MKLLIALTVLLVAASTVNAIELTEQVNLKEVEALMANLKKNVDTDAMEEVMGGAPWVVIGRGKEIQVPTSRRYASSIKYYKGRMSSAKPAAAIAVAVCMRYRSMGCSIGWTRARRWQVWCMRTADFGMRARMMAYAKGGFAQGGFYLGR